MVQPCEIAVKSLVPSIRSALARELTQTHGLKQKDVASLLGVTQSAVSKYTTSVRGALLKIENTEEVRPMIKEMVVSLANGRMPRYEFMRRFCEVCEIIRRQRLMCELCKRSDPSFDVLECFVCSK